MLISLYDRNYCINRFYELYLHFENLPQVMGKTINANLPQVVADFNYELIYCDTIEYMNDSPLPVKLYSLVKGIFCVYADNHLLFQAFCCIIEVMTEINACLFDKP